MIDGLLAWDASIVGWIARHRAAPADWLMIGLTASGYLASVWLVATLVLARQRLISRWAAWHVLLAIVVTHLLTSVALKPLVGRDRPFVASSAIVPLGLLAEASPSFPSGHAATSFAGALVLARAWPAGGALFWGLASLIALSRVYNGVHYPLDVLAGACVGVACATVVLGVSRWYSGGSGLSAPT